MTKGSESAARRLLENHNFEVRRSDAILIAFFGGIDNKPDWIKDVYNYIKENKLQVGLFSFFGGAFLQNALT